jgi:amidohydrolase
MGSDSCNRPDLKRVRIVTEKKTIEADVVFDGHDILVPLTRLEEIFEHHFILDNGAGTISIQPLTSNRHGLDLVPGIDEILKAVDMHLSLLTNVSADIFSNPEVGDQEYFASTMLADILRDAGFSVRHGLEGVKPLTGEKVQLKTAFKATMEGSCPGPTLAFMLEYDALPMGHGCGHNLIAVSGLAAALGLAGIMDRLPGQLVVMGTPAEEGGVLGGKIPLLHGGHFNGIDIAMITHGGDRWDTGSPWLAVKSATFTYKGIPAHAAAAPHQGRSALDALVLAYQGIEMLREHVRQGTRIHGIIRKGGAASNIVPEEAVATYSVRSLDNAYLLELMERIEQVAKGAAMACGCTVDIQWGYGYRSPVNVPMLDEMVLGLADALGAAPIKPWTALASSDLGNVGEMLPTVNLWFAAAPPGIELHTQEFMEAAGSPAGLQAAILAGKVLAASAARLMSHPDEVTKIKIQFEELKNKK